MRPGSFFLVAFAAVLSLCMPSSWAETNAQDVYAINSFYVALGSPPLPGWIATEGDPCTEAWQGVKCLGPNISGITINAANLGGQLSEALGNFTAIITIDLSNNNIGGPIPDNLPLTLQNFFLSANQLNGSVPSSLSKLTLLTAMSLNENHLSGDLPDAFQSLTGLINLDISSNNLSGHLPPSMKGLSSLTTMHAQNNQLSGTLDVLEDLPLQDLNIENNLFSGPIPVKLLSIPNFKKDGNPFNTINSTAPSPAPPVSSSPPVPLSPAPSSGPPNPNTAHTDTSDGASTSHTSKKNSMSTLKILGYVLLAIILFIILVLLVMYLTSKHQERKSRYEARVESEVGRGYRRAIETKYEEKVVKPKITDRETTKEDIKGARREFGENMAIAVQDESSKKEKEHKIGLRDSSAIPLAPPPPPPSPPPPPPPPPPSLPPPFEKVIINSISSAGNKNVPDLGKVNPPPTKVTSFSVASLQQYTNSFREENLIRDSRLGKVYLAELPDGRLLEVMKIDNANSRIPVDDFIELVLIISELRHPNIVELVGYCEEFEQRLLVYKHFSKMTLNDVLHGEDDFKVKLSWNARLKVALQAAKALEYLHEGCQPPLMHQDFEPVNILLNDGLAVRVCECGLSSLIASNSVTQLSGRLRAMYSYEAPEVNEFGSYTDKSDVYSFGIVMLELLTGRKPLDSSRPRSEQHLVRWAASQLYDINALSKMVDPSLGKSYSEKSLSCFADIISRCIQQEPEFRPAMSEVIQDLTRMIEDAARTSTSGDPI